MNEEASHETVKFVIAALRIFAKDGMVTAARYTLGQDRNEVTGEDVKKGLMYQARKFFEQADEQLQSRIQNEIVRMENESSDEDGEEDGEEEGEEDGEEEGEEDGEEDDERVEDMPREQCRKLVTHVDLICNSWDRWQPEDPVHCLIKRAIDNTPVGA